MWEVLTLQDVVPYLCNVCQHFCQLLREVYIEHGADWHIILYCDGVTPGAVLAPDNKRKSILWYSTILEFGSKLCHQELWFCLASIQASVSKLVPARLAGLTRHVVRDMVCGDRAIDTAGIMLPVGREGRLELVRFHYHATLADEEALSAMLGIKGSAGLSPCALRCWCVNKEKSCDTKRGVLPVTARGANIVDITCVNKADIDCKTDADVWADCDHLVRNVGHPDFKEIESCSGITYHPEGILFDLELRKSFKPSSSHRYDALHVLFSNGLLAAELMLFMKLAKQHTGKYFASFREYCERAEWHSPGTVKPQGVFSAAREKSSDTSLKAGASEQLVVYPVLRQWALQECIGIPAMRASLRSLLLLLDVADLVLEAATQRLRDQDVENIASRLDTAAFAYLEAFVNAHGREEMRHKHHELGHLADQLRADKRLLWCFTAERKHITAKAVMEHSKGMRAFAFGAVARMLTAQISRLEDDIPAWLSTLRTPVIEIPELGSDCRMSRSMVWIGCAVRHGNPLFVGHGRAVLILVVACVAGGGRFGVLGHACLRVRGDAFSSEWTAQPAIVQHWLVPTDAIQVARHWRFIDADRLSVLS